MIIPLSTILIKPLVTEKSVNAQGQSKYTFSVHSNATKKLIKEAIKKYYGKTVLSVNTLNNPKKERLVKQGKFITKRSPNKRAVVTFAKKVTLDFNAFS